MKQICGDCLHYNACAAWNIGGLANTDAGNCINFEHIHLYDSVKVVRCKDCEWYREGNFLAPTKFCYRLKDRDGKNMAYNMSEMDYCSYGKRKEGEE